MSEDEKKWLRRTAGLSLAGCKILKDQLKDYNKIESELLHQYPELERSIKRGFHALLDLVKLVDETLETEKRHEDLIKEILQDEAEKQSKADFLKPRFDWPDDE